MNQPKQSITELFSVLDAGVFGQKAVVGFSDTCLGVAVTRKKGKIHLIFDVKPIGDSNQVQITHTLRYTKPTYRGKATEDDTTSTPLYVGHHGQLTVAPAAQQSLDFAAPAAQEA